jgi:hypothetical protein
MWIASSQTTFLAMMKGERSIIRNDERGIFLSCKSQNYFSQLFSAILKTVSIIIVGSDTRQGIEEIQSHCNIIHPDHRVYI